MTTHPKTSRSSVTPAASQKKKRTMERNKSNVCKHCGQTFYSVRYTAETCSPKCRKAYSRSLQRIQDYAVQLDFILDGLKKYKGRDGEYQAQDVIRRCAKRAADIVDFWD